MRETLLLQGPRLFLPPPPGPCPGTGPSQPLPTRVGAWAATRGGQHGELHSEAGRGALLQVSRSRPSIGAGNVPTQDSVVADWEVCVDWLGELGQLHGAEDQCFRGSWLPSRCLREAP